MRARRYPRKGAPESIDAFLVALSPEQRAALQKLRKDIRAAVPRAEECISYGVPAFRLDGRFLLAFGAGAHHCAFYPGAVVAMFKDELEGYQTSKGTIRFQPGHPLPSRLVRRIVKAQVARRVAGSSRAQRTAEPKTKRSTASRGRSG